MDLVYILGTGSVWEDNEIRFSLRSAAKNIVDLEKVFIVGERPLWLQNIVHIPCKDSEFTPGRIGYQKTRRACSDPRLSKNFFFMNDDFFILKPIRAATYPYYFHAQRKAMHNLNHNFISSIKKKRAQNPNFPFRDLLNYEVHRPIRYNKKLYLDMPVFDTQSLAFAPRSFYCNYYGVGGVGCRDPLFYSVQSIARINFFTADLTDFSIASSAGYSSGFQKWIAARFPKRSRFEKA